MTYRDNHAVAFPYRSAASKEGYHEHDSAYDDEHPWCDRDVGLQLLLNGCPVQLERYANAYHC